MSIEMRRYLLGMKPYFVVQLAEGEGEAVDMDISHGGGLDEDMLRATVLLWAEEYGAVIPEGVAADVLPQGH